MGAAREVPHTVALLLGMEVRLTVMDNVARAVFEMVLVEEMEEALSNWLGVQVWEIGMRLGDCVIELGMAVGTRVGAMLLLAFTIIAKKRKMDTTNILLVSDIRLHKQGYHLGVTWNSSIPVYHSIVTGS